MGVINGTLVPWLRNPLTGLFEGGYNPGVGGWSVVLGNFGSKVLTSTPVAEDFSGYNENETLLTGAWTQYQSNGGATTRIFDLPHRTNGMCAYSNWARGQFATSYRYLPQRSKRVFMSYWTRAVNNTSQDFGVWKPNRLTSSTRSLASGGGGGGGVYNGVGNLAFTNINPQSLGGAQGQTTFTPVDPANPSNNMPPALGNVYQDTTAADWVRIENFVDLGTPDVANGRFYTRCGNFSFQDYTNQTLAHSQREFFIDTVLLGLEFANPNKWIYIPDDVVPNTDYSITITSLSTTFTTNSGNSPTLSKAEILQNLYDQLATVLPTAPNSVGVFLNPDAVEIRVGNPNNGLAHTFSSNMAYRAWGAAVCDLVVDYSRAQFYLCPTSTFDHGTAEILKYRNWTAGVGVEIARFGGQAFDGTKYLFFVDDNETPNLIGGK